jgi:1-pyrroline-5-carboxylate dehydrogenase
MPVKTKTAKRKPARSATPKKSAAIKAPRITYATLTVTPKDDAQYDRAVARVREQLGKHFSMYINGEERKSSGGEFAHPSPVNTNWVVSYFPKGTRDDARAGIRAARDAYPKWSAMDYRARVKLMRGAADLIIERRFDLAAWMAFEVGKNRGESLAEINETAELIRYYCERMEFHKGFVLPLESPGAGQETLSVLRPYGVWGVIAPWNFPMALATGMSAGALIAGNTIVLKPASDSPVLGYEIYRAFADAGLPGGVVNFVTGPGSTVGAELQENRDVDGLVFTGSKEVGMRVYKEFAKDYPKPVIAEMGGKNPAIVTASADLDAAAEGVMRAAFGFDGQKCSACSRVYVDNRVKEKFLALLIGYTQSRVKVGDPTQKETFMGPVINQAAADTYARAADDARRGGGKFLYGGNVIQRGDLGKGFFVEPAIVELDKSHKLFQEELFLPFLVVAGVNSFDEAMQRANDSEYGLCAGVYSREQKEIDAFFNNIQAGVTYSNRRAGATTGAWPGINSFGGWKGSGSSGKSGLGPFYVQQFMREQSRWIVKK